MKNNKYRGKYFSILGDSISTLAGYNPEGHAVHYKGTVSAAASVYKPEDTWWGEVIERLGGKLLVNDSFSGSLVCAHPACLIPSYACSDERTSGLSDGDTNPDVILIYMGTNDWGSGLRITSANKDDLNVFENAYGAMLGKLKKNYPKATIFCLTLSQTFCSRSPSYVFDRNYGGEYIGKYCDTIKKCADIYGARVIDLFYNEVKYDTLDGFHPNYSGMRTIAKAVLEEMEKE